jgi:hypothetical protein
MLSTILDALEALPSDQVSDQASDQVSDQVKSLLTLFAAGEEHPAAELIRRLGLKHMPAFRKNYLRPALAAGWIEMTAPASPRSPSQRYRLTAKGRRWISPSRSKRPR